MLKRFFKDNSGIAAIELAMLLPIFLIMLISGYEVGRYIMILNKIQSAGYTLSNIVAQTWPATVLNACDGGRLSESTLTNISSGMNQLMEPFSKGDEDFKVIVTSMQKNPNPGVENLLILWRHETGTLTDVENEVTGAPGGPANFRPDATEVQNKLLAGLRVGETLTPGQRGENVLLLEAFYRYVPVFPAIFGQVSDTFTERTIAKRVYFYNRLGKAIYLPPTYPVEGELGCGVS